MLSLDRPFTYELDGSLGAGVGSLVQVPFHGRAVRGWILGPSDDVPGRVLAVRKVMSPVRFFDDRMLELLKWVSGRYVAPLASVIARSHPPRVASEEARASQRDSSYRSGPARGPIRQPAVLEGYRGGGELLEDIGRGGGRFIVRPDPLDEVQLAVDAVGVALSSGHTAIVLVPEAEPLPATASGVAEVFGARTAMFVGGDKRERYRMWLDVLAGRYVCVVGTRPAVFAPLPRVGIVWISRESHSGHREERSPYYHVRDVALARARLGSGTCVMSAQCPSAEATGSDATLVSPRRRAWPAVEVVKPGPEGRAPRLVAAVRDTRRAFLYEPLPGSGIAQICRACKSPANCGSCAGPLRREEGVTRCLVCAAPGRCAVCGSRDFGVRSGGAERVERWAARTAAVPVRRLRPGERPARSGVEEISVGGSEAVKDLGALRMRLVGILDADLALRRPGIGAVERALATWMEAAGWARPDGRVIVQTQHPNDPAVQSLVAGNPDRFHRAEVARRQRAGFPVGHPVFRVVGARDIAGAIGAMQPTTLLASEAEGQTVCLLALAPDRVEEFGRLARELSARGVIARVEAEPHL